MIFASPVWGVTWASPLQGHLLMPITGPCKPALFILIRICEYLILPKSSPNVAIWIRPSMNYNWVRWTQSELHVIWLPSFTLSFLFN